METAQLVLSQLKKLFNVKLSTVNNWLIYSDFVLWLETVSHNGLDTEVYDLRPGDYTTTTTTTTTTPTTTTTTTTTTTVINWEGPSAPK